MANYISIAVQLRIKSKMLNDMNKISRSDLQNTYFVTQNKIKFRLDF